MADTVALTSSPPAQPASKGPEPVVQQSRGSTQVVTVDSTPQPPAEKPDPSRPEWLPSEFKTPEEFAKAYQEKVAEKAKADVKTEAPAPPKPEEAVEKAGLKMEDLNKEFAETGKLSDESLKALEKAGIQKAQVDEYISGQQAKVQLYEQRVAESVGGQENLQATLKWAETALSEAEIAAANKALQSGDEAQAKLMLTGLNQRRIAEQGSEPSFVSGRSQAVGAIQPYESSQQLTKDMNSREYKTDPAFRAQVERRLAASKF